MEELITTFHIDWKLMIAQIVNFGLVFAALYFIAAKPLSKLVKNRTKEITDGLENAESAKRELANADIKKKEIIFEARNEAKGILVQSQGDGKKIIAEAKSKAEVEKEAIIKQAKIEAEKEKQSSDDAVKKEASVLVADGVRKVIEGYVKQGHGDKIIEGILAK
ncbi:MAG: F0F1 ATP synthase subunit B [Candidatus Paceibacterota bacterium]|jgi:F-type H+-transporting ATPase subunit b